MVFNCFRSIAICALLGASLAAAAQATLQPGNGGTGISGSSFAHNIASALSCADTSGSGTAQSCNTSPSFTPAAGDWVIYSTTTANAGDVTANVNSLGAKHIRKNLGASVLASGDLPANVNVPLYYDGTYWEIPTIGNSSSGGVTSVAQTVPSDLFTVSGSPITSAGTLAIGKQNVSAGYVLAGPQSATQVTPFIDSTPAQGSGTGTTVTITLNSASQAGDEVYVVAYGSGVSISSVTDSASQSYTQIDSFANGFFVTNWHFDNSVAGVTSVTLHLSSSGTAYGEVFTMANVTTSGAVDAHSHSVGGTCSGGQISLAPITTTHASDLILSTYATNAAAAYGSVSPFSTVTGSTLDTSSISYGGLFYNPSVAGTYNPAVTCPSNLGAINYSVAFLPATGSSTGVWGARPLVPSDLNFATPVYNGVGAFQASAHTVVGSCTLGTSCSVTLTSPAAFTSSTTYQCTCTDQTSAAACKFAPSTGSAFALTGTGTDVLGYVCVGN